MRVYLTGIAALVLIYVFGIGYPLVQLIAAGLLAIVAIPAWKVIREAALTEERARRTEQARTKLKRLRAAILHLTADDHSPKDDQASPGETVTRQ